MRAAVAPLNTSPVTHDFVLYATHSARIHQRAIVLGGDIGVRDAGQAPFLVSGFELGVDSRAETDPSHDLLADSVELKKDCIVGDIGTNELNDRGGAHGLVYAFPAMPEFPPLAPVIAGTTDTIVNQGDTLELPPSSSFATVVVYNSATLRLAGGTYHLASLELKNGSRLEALAPVEVRVQERVFTHNGAYVGPAVSSSLSAADVRIEVSGINGISGTLDDEPRTASFGQDGHVHAVVLAPNGMRCHPRSIGSFRRASPIPTPSSTRVTTRCNSG